MKKIFIWTLGVLFCYGVIICGFFNLILKPGIPDAETVFSPGQQFKSDVEGLTITVKKIEKGMAYVHTTLAPHAPGPPEHIHETFDEYFRVESGSLSLMINGQKRIFTAGEWIVIPKGTPHRPFNETDGVTVLNDSTDLHPVMPGAFLYGLSCMYPEMDRAGSADAPGVLMVLARYGNQIDTWLADKPVPAQKLLRWLLGPFA